MFDQPLSFRPLVAADLPIIAGWFADADTQRYLGGPDWPGESLALAQCNPGSRFVWLAGLGREPVGLLDVETYADGTASVAVVIAPERRGQGLGTKLMLALEKRPELRSVQWLDGGVEASNVASVRLLRRAGYVVSQIPNAEGFLLARKALRSGPTAT